MDNSDPPALSPSRYSWVGGSAWSRLLQYTAPASFYVVVCLATGATHMGDTVGYATDIARGVRWESGHLLLRPLGWVVWRLLEPLIRQLAGVEALHSVLLVLLAQTWVSGLIAVTALFAILRRLTTTRWVSYGVTATFVCSYAFLNYCHTGCSYVPALSALLVCLWSLVRSRERSGGWLWALAGGMFLALAVCMWLPFIFALPAALALPVLIPGGGSQRWQLAAAACASCLVVIGVCYSVGAVQVGVSSPGGLLKWVREASHGNTVGGFQRVVFGAPRSFIEMDDAGVLFKRYLLRDPYNPVSFGELVRLSLWKMALFYLFILAVVSQLARSRSDRWRLWFFTLSTLPVLAFACYWKGADLERYLALYPAVFLGAAWALEKSKSSSVVKVVLGSFMAVLIVSNLGTMAKPVLLRAQGRAMARLDGVSADLRPGTLVVTLNHKDELWKFNHTFLLHPLFRRYGEFVYSLGGSDWQRRFARRVQEAWGEAGEVWVSTRMVADRPLPGWGWVEGNSTGRRWEAVIHFFRQFDYSEHPQTGDGFLLLLRSAENERLVAMFADSE